MSSPFLAKSLVRLQLSLVAGVAMIAAGCAGLGSWNHAAPGPTDANIAAIVIAANNTDISYAKLAPNRALAQSVKDFAARMLTDHTRVGASFGDLLTRLNITPEENSTSLDFRDESTTKRDILRDLDGRAFDSTYIANEVSYHTKLLGALDGLLIPKATAPELKATLSNIRTAVASHLEHAQRVQTMVLAR